MTGPGHEAPVTQSAHDREIALERDRQLRVLLDAITPPWYSRRRPPFFVLIVVSLSASAMAAVIWHDHVDAYRQVVVSSDPHDPAYADQRDHAVTLKDRGDIYWIVAFGAAAFALIDRLLPGLHGRHDVWLIAAAAIGIAISYGLYATWLPP